MSRQENVQQMCKYILLTECKQALKQYLVNFHKFSTAPSRRGARDSLRMCVFVLLTASQGA